jgi:phosphopantothenoylcysteine synthetase/decarboxylase
VEADPDVGTGEVLDAVVADAEEAADVLVAAVMRVMPLYAVALGGNMVGGSVSISNEVTVRRDHVDGMTMLAPESTIEATPVVVVAAADADDGCGDDEIVDEDEEGEEEDDEDTNDVDVVEEATWLVVVGVEVLLELSQGPKTH